MSPNNCDKCGHDRNMCSCSRSVAQVGGDHYQAEYQHWDWVVDIKMPYLAGCATKYVSRWWKKNGVEDLKKARTYVEKMIATYAESFDPSFNPPYRIRPCTERFVIANKLPAAEADFCWTLCGKRDMAMLLHALQIVDNLIRSAGQAAAQGKAQPLATLAPQVASPALPRTTGQAQGVTGQAAGTNSTTASKVSKSRPLSGLENPMGYDVEG